MEDGRQVSEILSSLSLFADIERPQLEAIAHTLEEQRFAPNERILRQGLTGSAFYVIIEGEAAVRLDGKDVAKLGRGDFFGEISILLGDPPVADVVALGPLRCMVLPGPAFKEFLETNPKLSYRMLQAEAGRLRHALQWQD